MTGSHAALALFDVSHRGSSVWIVEPAHAEPARCPISITPAELAELLPVEQASDAARKTIFRGLPQLSSALLAPLHTVIERYDLLYLVPAAELYGIPFAALQLDDGDYLIEHAAIALAPSASVLGWCLGRRRPQQHRRFLALGAGGETWRGERISFAAQALAVSAAVAGLPDMTAHVLPETTKAEQLLDAASDADVLHLECHGALDSTLTSQTGAPITTLEASYLDLADRLTAQQVAQRPEGLTADLVFLNACLSATFTSGLRNEAGGFWHAFLLGGTPSLVATLTIVDPRCASELAAEFYAQWLGGRAGKAHSLQAAQQAMLARGRDPEDWAAHVLIGDGS